MKIGYNLHFGDEYMSGVEYYALGALGSLLELGGDNEYVVFTNKPELVLRHIGGWTRLSLRNARYPRGRLFRILWEHAVLPTLARRETLDVLHCPCYICPIRPAVPYVVTVHDTIALDHPEWCKRTNAAYYRLAMRKAMKNASAVVAVSHASAGTLLAHSPALSSRVHVIHSGIDRMFAQRASPSDMNTVRARYSLPEQFILYVGNIEPKKNLGDLLRAYRLLMRSHLPHSLVFVGHRSWRCGHVLREAHSADLAGKVHLAGYVAREDLPVVYQMASLYVCASLYEGFGFPPLEAMASGLPVISSGRGALTETLADAALTVEPADPEALAEAMALMLSDGRVRLDYARRGIERSRQFTWESAAARLDSLYKDLIA
jgi:glycosyltransferase involved in cell wall biosynthesis